MIKGGKEMNKWEYDVVMEDLYEKIIDYPNATFEEQKALLENWLNERGQNGWKLVGRSQNCIIFKRKLEQ